MAKKLSRRQIARYIAEQLVAGVSQKKLAQQLAGYLLDTRRTAELPLLIRDIQTNVADAGYVTGRVSSAHELSAATISALEVFTKQQTGAQHVFLDRSVDASLLGGFKLETPGRVLDETIARKLTILRTRYKKA